MLNNGLIAKETKGSGFGVLSVVERAEQMLVLFDKKNKTMR